MPRHNGDQFTFVNTRLDAESLAELETIKSYHGIESSSEVVRFLLRREARRITRPDPTLLTDTRPEYLADADRV